MGGIDTRYFPLFADLSARPCVVVGDGAVAEKRIRQLLKYGAEVMVFTPTPSGWMLQAEVDGKLTIERRPYAGGDLVGAFLAVCVSDDEEIRRGVVAEAENTGCFLNVVDDAQASSYILPSVIHRDPIQISITTAGAAPELAKMMRLSIEGAITPQWGTWVKLVAEVRGRALATWDDLDVVTAAVSAATDSGVLERLNSGDSPTPDEFLAVGALLAARKSDATAESDAAPHADAGSEGAS